MTERTALLGRVDALSPGRRALFELLLLEEAAGGRGTREDTGRAPRATASAPLSFGQERMWLHERLQPGGGAYNTSMALRLLGPLDPGTLRRSLEEVVRRHETLRTTFSEERGSPVQTAGPPFSVALPMADVAALPAEAREAEARRLAGRELLRPFDLWRGPLFRVLLLRLEREEHVLSVSMHHIVSDAWSMGVLVRELSVLYQAFAAGRPSPLPELPMQYAELVRWQRGRLEGEGLERLLNWWRERLAGAPEVVEVPTDLPRPAVRCFRGGLRVRQLPPALAAAAARLGGEQSATLFIVLLAAFELLLHARTGRSDLVVGVDVANRTRPEAEAIIGLFVNQLVLRVGLQGDPPFLELLERVRETAAGAYAHQDLPFGHLVEELAPERSLSRNPLFQVMFGLYNVPAPAAEEGGLEVRPLELEAGAAVFDLSLYVQESAEGLACRLGYDSDLYTPATAERLLEDYELLLRWALEAPEARVSEILARLEAEKRRRQAEEGGELRKSRAAVLKTARRRTAE
ncbi:MAG TPA: condensation domain-containing protein [Thermoanaerobaculia bacterium]|nr:condensation domain-containing protein [Thermoanaerobaculia bacterium]